MRRSALPCDPGIAEITLLLGELVFKVPAWAFMNAGVA
jgi:hypothetical protein